MDNWLLALALKPFVALVLFLAAALIARAINKRMKDSRLKRLLFRRIDP